MPILDDSMFVRWLQMRSAQREQERQQKLDERAAMSDTVRNTALMSDQLRQMDRDEGDRQAKLAQIEGQQAAKLGRPQEAYQSPQDNRMASIGFNAGQIEDKDLATRASQAILAQQSREEAIRNRMMDVEGFKGLNRLDLEDRKATSRMGLQAQMDTAHMDRLEKELWYKDRWQRLRAAMLERIASGKLTDSRLKAVALGYLRSGDTKADNGDWAGGHDDLAKGLELFETYGTGQDFLGGGRPALPQSAPGSTTIRRSGSAPQGAPGATPLLDEVLGR